MCGEDGRPGFFGPEIWTVSPVLNSGGRPERQSVSSIRIRLLIRPFDS